MPPIASSPPEQTFVFLGFKGFFFFDPFSFSFSAACDVRLRLDVFSCLSFVEMLPRFAYSTHFSTLVIACLIQPDRPPARRPAGTNAATARWQCENSSRSHTADENSPVATHLLILSIPLATLTEVGQPFPSETRLKRMETQRKGRARMVMASRTPTVCGRKTTCARYVWTHMMRVIA